MKFSITCCVLLCVALKTGNTDAEITSGDNSTVSSTPSTNMVDNSTVSSTPSTNSVDNSTVSSTPSTNSVDNSTVSSTVNDNSTFSSTVNVSTDSSTVNVSTDSSTVNVSTDSSTVNVSTDSSTVNVSTDSSTVNDNSTDSSTVNDNSTDSSTINDNSTDISTVNDNSTVSYTLNDSSTSTIANVNDTTTIDESTNDAHTDEYNSTSNDTTTYKTTNDASCYEQSSTVPTGSALSFPEIRYYNGTLVASFDCTEGSCIVKKNLTLNSTFVAVKKQPWSADTSCPIQLTSALNEPIIPVNTFLLYNIPVVGYPLHATFHLQMSEVTCSTRTDVTVADDVYNVSLQTNGNPRSGNVSLRIPVVKAEYLTNWTLVVSNSVGQPLVIRFKLVSETGEEHSVSCDDQSDFSSVIIIAVPTALSIFIVIVLIIVIIVVLKRKKQIRRNNEIRARRFDIVEPDQKSQSRDAESVNFDRQVSLTSFTGSCHSIQADDNSSLDSLSGRNGLHDVDSHDDKQLSLVNSGKFTLNQNSHVDHSPVTLAPPAESTPPVPEKKKRSRKHGILHADDVNPYNFPRNSNAVCIQGSQESFAVV